MAICAQNDADRGELAAQPNSKERFDLTIDVVAGMFKLSTLALRLFELRGFVRRRNAGNKWVYNWSDCELIALLAKARQAGIAIGPLKPVARAMDANASKATADAGRAACLALIQNLESRQQSAADVLSELHRIDWELSNRHGAKGSRKTDEQS